MYSPHEKPSESEGTSCGTASAGPTMPFEFTVSQKESNV